MSRKFELPDLGEGVESAEVAQVLVAKGDVVEAEQPVIELETEKAVADVPCPFGGKVVEVHVSEGDSVSVGDLLLTIEEEGEGRGSREEDRDESTQADASASKEDEGGGSRGEGRKDDEGRGSRDEDRDEGAQADASASKEDEGGGSRDEGRKDDEDRGSRDEDRDEKAQADASASDEKRDAEPEKRKAPSQEERLPVPAGPATRRLARKLDVDLERVDGSGPGGRITQEDVVRQHDRAGGGAEAEPELPDFTEFGEVEREPLGGIAKAAVDNLSRSARLVPQVTQHALADVTELEEARQSHAERDEEGPKISMTALAVKAAAIVLGEFPRFNASLDGRSKELVLKKYVHVGIAVDTEAGLLVPVIRDADEKTVTDVAAEVLDLAKKARDRKLQVTEMQGASFTVSNQGPIGPSEEHLAHTGGVLFTPIVAWPQVAILGLSRARWQVEVVGGQSQIRLMLPLSLSYDHRAVNGADAAKFVQRLSELLSDSFEMLIES